MSRLGGEWHDEAAPRPVPLQEARRLFWWQVGEVAEGVLHSLQADVLPSFRAVLETAGPHDNPREWDLTYFTSDLTGRRRRAEQAIREAVETPARSRIAERLRLLEVLEAELRRWADTCHLTEAWCLDDALFALGYWARKPEADLRHFPTRATSVVTAIPPVFEFREAWGYAWTPEASFRESATTRSKEELEAFVRRVNADAAAAGLKQTRKRGSW